MIKDVFMLFLNKIVLGWPGLIAVLIVLFLIFRPFDCSCNDPIEQISRGMPFWHDWELPDPSGWFHDITWPDTVAVAHHAEPIDTSRIIEITQIEQNEDHIQVHVVSDSQTTTVHEFDPPVAGHAHVYIDPERRVRIAYDQYAFDPGLTAGVTGHGIDACLETFYIRRLLFLKHLRAPVIFGEYDLWSDNRNDIYVGIGAGMDLWPQHTPFKFGFTYGFNTSDWSKRFGLYLNIQIFD